MDIVTNRSEVIEELITRVKQGDVNASIQPGTPLYDLLVYRFADVITDERELINILTNVARVSPMFGEDGQLLSEYSDMDTFLTDRFFLSRPEDNAVYDTLYLRFSDRAGLNVLPGSRVWYGSLQLDVRPTHIPYDSELWKGVMVNDRKLYEHPVEINIRLDTDEYIPATDAWITGDVKIKTDKFMFVLGARSTKSVSSVVTPKVTLEYLRNSISNRSMSNPRAILYNIRSNLGFSPDQLVKAAVLPVSDRCLIERRKVLFQDNSASEASEINPGRTASDFKTLTAIVAGDAKVMLDYGTTLYRAPVKAVVLDRSDPLYSELNPMICKVNPHDSVTEINVKSAEHVTGYVTLSAPAAVTGSNPLLPVVERTLTAHITAEIVTVDEHGNADTVTTALEGSTVITGTAAGNFRMWLKYLDEAPVTHDVCGWVSYTLDTELLTAATDGTLQSDTFEYNRDNYILFRIDTSGLGLLSPVSIGTESDLEGVQRIMESSNPDDLMFPGTTASASAPGTSLRVHHGDHPLFDSACFRVGDPETADNALLRTAAARIYWKVVTSATAESGVYDFTTQSSDLHMRYLVLSHDPDYVEDPIGIYPITHTPDYVIDCHLDANLTLRIKYLVDELIEWENTYNNLKEQYFTVPEVFIRNSNRYLVFAMNPNGSSMVQDFDTWLLYYGTDPELMTKAQELFLNRRLAEVGTRIMVSPFRPVIFTAYWDKNYVAQYIPVEDPDDETGRYDEVRSKFVDLLAWLENYMSSYSGKISDMDFATIVADGQSATGILLKRLDWTLFTQRGYAVRGHLDINLDKECRIDWNKDVLETVTLQIDKDPAFIEEEKEMFVTDEKLYRPVFSRVGV